MNKYPEEKRIELYRLLMVIVLVVLIVTGSLIRQNSLLREKNRKLTLQLDSLMQISTNLHQGKR